MRLVIQSCNPIIRSKQAGLKTIRVVDKRPCSTLWRRIHIYSSIWSPFQGSQGPFKKMHSRIVNVACHVLFMVSICGGQPSAPAAAPLAAPTTLYLVTGSAEPTPAATLFQPSTDDIVISVLSVVITETLPAATIYPDAVIPASITPSGARGHHMAYRAHPRNAGCFSEYLALGALRRSALEIS